MASIIVSHNTWISGPNSGALHFVFKLLTLSKCLGMRGIIILLLCIEISQAQSRISYLNRANQAEFEFLNKNIFVANKILKRLNIEYKHLNTKDYFYLGITYYLLNDTLRGYDFLEMFVFNFGTPSLYLDDLRSLYPELFISKFQENKLDSLVRRRKIIFQDSIIYSNNRKSIIDSINSYVEKDRANRPNGDLQDIEKDKNNQLGFLSYLKKNGIPNPYLFGDDYTTILLHVEAREVLEKYKPFIFQALKDGSATPFDYAILIDREIATLGKTKYGSRQIKPATNEIKVIQNNRKKIGMSIYFNGSNLYPRTSKDFMLTY